MGEKWGQRVLSPGPRHGYPRKHGLHGGKKAKARLDRFKRMVYNILGGIINRWWVKRKKGKR